MANFNWTCPRCNSPQTVTDPKQDVQINHIGIGQTKNGWLAYKVTAIACANENCGRETVHFEYGIAAHGPAYSISSLKEALGSTFFPSSIAKILPECVPAAIVSDYTEACEISFLSPKASATLSRRCIQGMIRDFCGISRPRLIDEINELKKLATKDALPKGVTHESIEAIDAIRRIGNIGAHMESDINVIVDVDPDEAETLAHLIETLIDDWYVARRKREERFAKVNAIAASKAGQKAIGLAESSIEAAKTQS